MRASFHAGRRLHLAIRNEQASEGYTTDVMCRLFAEESGGEYDVRPMVLGHLQQGGNPTPFDRVHATRLAAYGVRWLSDQIGAGAHDWGFIASREGRLATEPIGSMGALTDLAAGRPNDQWWLGLKPVMAALASEPGA